MKVDGDSLSLRYKNVIAVLEKNLKYLESVGLDSQVSQDYKRVLASLKAKSLVEVFSVLDKKNPKNTASKDAISAMSGEDLAKLTLKEIRQKISSPDVSRSSIEKVASVRFGVSKSGLSSLKSKDALLEKIDNLLSNEGVHEIISRAAIAEDETKKT